MYSKISTGEFCLEYKDLFTSSELFGKLQCYLIGGIEGEEPDNCSITSFYKKYIFLICTQ